MRHGILAVVLVAASAAGPQSSVASRIAPNWIEPHVRFLSDSLLEGRETGTRGHEIAAAYVASEFARLGLRPGTPSGYFQPVALRRSDVESASFTITGPRGPVALANHQDFLVHPDMAADTVDVTAPLVFVGFGVTNPPNHYDDYAGIDARGKIVVILGGAPMSIPRDERAVVLRQAPKEQNARAHGAVGIIDINPLVKPMAFWEEHQDRQLDHLSWLDAAQDPQSLYLERGAAIHLTREGARTLFAAASRSFEDVATALRTAPQSFDLPLTATFRGRFHHQTLTSPNVIGVLPGSDPSLRDEYVVFSAHLDHVGISPFETGDKVNHGALDNAGGVATILAVARAFASAPAAPKRSVLFIAVTGEEHGLLGSDYFVHNPTVPLSRIVADVNCDNFLWVMPLKDVAGIAGRYSTLAEDVKAVTAQLGVPLSDDPIPNQALITRSDHYAFLRAGVPSVFFFDGPASGDATRTGDQLIAQWLSDVHHTPKDTIDQSIDWNSAVTCARLNYLLGDRLANAPTRPQWVGSPFFLPPTPRAQNYN